MGQQALQYDDANFRRDKHSGTDHNVIGEGQAESTQEYLQSVKRKPSKTLKGGRFRSVQKVRGEHLNTGEDQYNHNSV